MSTNDWFDMNNPQFVANPYPYYHMLREMAPVFLVPPGKMDFPDNQRVFMLSRYDDVILSLRDKRFIKESQDAGTPAQTEAVPAIFQFLDNMMLFRDPPNHTRLRSIVNKAFTPVRIESYAAQIESLARHLLQDAMQNTHFDLLETFAEPLPIMVIAEMLGVPIEDRDQFKLWSSGLGKLIDPTSRDALAIEEGTALLHELVLYLKDLIAERKKHPTEDLFSALIQAEENGDRLTQDEVLANTVLLLIAGHETTSGLLSNGMITLSEHTDAMEKLRAYPQFMPSAVEECLRYESPIVYTIRLVADEIKLRETQLHAGDVVMPLLGAANRDAAVFPDPDTFDIERSPNRHVAFGMGPHFCLGAPLARLEGRIALQLLIHSHLEVNHDPSHWFLSLGRGVNTLPVSCE